MTINEYKELHGLTHRALAERLGVTVATVCSWTKGCKAKPKNAESLKRLGIEHPVLESEDYACRSRKGKQENHEGTLKYFQIHAVKTCGNTIVSKKHSPEEIINVFADIGINVKVREYDIQDVCGGDTYYVVERLK